MIPIMHLAVAGITLLKSFEKLATQAYPDEGGVWTLGWGHTGHAVIKGDCCTAEQADEWLRQDVATAEAAVNRLVRVPLSQNQFDALVVFTYNVGSGNLAQSALLAAINAGKSAAECVPLFLHFVKANGQPSKGLIRRRNAEMELFKRS